MFRFSLRFKITFLVMFIIAVASTTLGYFTFKDMNNVLNNAAGLGAVAPAEILANSMDPSLVKAYPDALNHPSLPQASEQLNAIVQQGAVEFVRVIKTDEKLEQAQYLFGAPEGNIPEHLSPGTIIRRGDPNDSILLWHTSPGKVLWQFDDRPDTRYMVGWAPIIAGGQQIGLIQVGVNVNQVGKALISLLLAIIIACFIFTFLSGAVAFKFASTFEKTAVTDGLMGIYNHKYFKQRLEQEVAKARRYGQPTSLVLIDIDFFKRVNDTYGHQTGDIVLKNTAKIVTETARTTDVVARYGGEEIGIILTHTGVAGAQEFAERLRLKVSHFVHRDPEEKAEFRCTISVGVAQVEQGVGMTDLIKRADAALYHSKGSGRNRVTIYQDDILMPPEELQTKPHAKAR